MAKINKSRRCRGAEMMEFTLALLPLLMMIFLLLDACWGIFVKGTLAFAAHEGVRVGITITKTQATAATSDLTTMVKAMVQKQSLGLLSGATGLSYIKVNYYQPPAAGSTDPVTDVSNQSDGNSPSNIMQVSVQGYPLRPLVPRLFGLGKPVDVSSTAISAIAADIIEPSRDVPPIGVAP
jgi:Flp pilus assembly protein TadG